MDGGNANTGLLRSRSRACVRRSYLQAPVFRECGANGRGGDAGAAWRDRKTIEARAHGAELRLDVCSRAGKLGDAEGGHDALLVDVRRTTFYPEEYQSAPLKTMFWCANDRWSRALLGLREEVV